MCGNAAITVSNDNPSTAADATIWIAPGTQARVILDNVNIQSPIPVTIERNRDAGGNTVSPQTSLWLTLAKGSENTLTATLDRRAPAIHCGEGTTLVIDDDVPNLDISGNAIAMDPKSYPGRIPAGTTFKGADGKTYTAGSTPGGDRLGLLESSNPGSLTATGGILSSAIGGGVHENAGRMIFNGGDIKATAQNNNVNQGMGAGIGGGHGSCGTYMEFNGGRVEAKASFHGAGIGGGAWAWSQIYPDTESYMFADALDCGIPSTTDGSGSNDAARTQAGDIYINGGTIIPRADAHGNALGQGCVSNNVGHEIVIAGGTVLPDTSAPHIGNGNPYAIGANQGNVAVVGGSIRIGTVDRGNGVVSNEKYQALINGAMSYDSAYGAYPYDPSSTSNPIVKMVAIDLMAELEKTGSAGDNPIIDWDLKVGGVSYPYGAPARFTDGKLYLWLPEEAMKQQISVTLTYEDEDGNVREVLPLFREPEQSGDLLKRFLDFQITDEAYLKSLTKYHDGTPLPAYDLSAPGHAITTPAPDNKVLNKVTDEAGNQLVKYYYQPFDKVPDGGDEPVPTGPETSETVDDGSGHQVTRLPSNAGAVKLTMVSKQYSDENSSDADIVEFSKSYWGHRAFLWGEIMPIASQVRDVAAEWVDEADAGQRPGGNAHDSDHALKVSAVIERSSTVDGRPGSEATKPTAASPEGRVQLYVDGEPVGVPIELRFEDGKDADGKVIMGADGKPAFPKNAERGGNDADGHWTSFSYTFKPSETDYLVPGVGVEGRHEVSLRFLPPSDSQKKAGAPANYLASAAPDEDGTVPRVEVAIEPIDPNPTVTPQPDPDRTDPDAPEPEVSTGPGKPADPNADPGKPGDKVFRGEIVTTWGEPSDTDPHPGRVLLKVTTPSSGKVSVTDAEGNVFEADFLRGEDGEPVRAEDGSYTLVLDPTAVGRGQLTFKQEPNGAYTGSTWIYGVTVRPQPKIAPAPALSKEAENLTHPDGPTQPGDRIRYTVTASNGAAGSLWTGVVISDPLPACLDLDERSVRLSNPRDGIADTALVRADAAAAGDVGKFSLSAPGADGRQVLSAPAGDVAGGASATLTFECTVRDDAAAPGAGAADLGNVASATGKRPNPDDPDGPDVGPVAPPDTDPATPPGGGTVAPADPRPEASKAVENLSDPDARVTHLGDVLRYTVELRNDGPANSCLMGAVVSDPLPAGIEPVPGTIRLAVDGGKAVEVPDAAYDAASRTIAVSVGDLWGGHAAVLTFDAVVGEGALGADAANVAHVHGKVPSESPDARPQGPEPGEPAEPPAGEPVASTPPASPAPVVPDDPAEGDVSIEKAAENLTRGDGTTRVGDTVRYTVALRNGGPATGWMDAVIRDDVPRGLEPLAGTIRLALPDGSTVAVDDTAYDPATRILAVAAGQLYGGQEIVLAFDALVTADALDADIGNVAVGYGTPPSAWDPDGPHPAPGEPFSPDGGWDAFEEGRQKVASAPAYPPGADASGGVLPEERPGDASGKATATIRHKLAQTGDTLLAAAMLPVAAALAAGAALLASRRRQRAAR
ncbi:hypothetical protein [uncultured Adlercreutzia sp.]|uniref:hypothetical protein n=1 Tax=uncultured Adlercreutzia sp. TaxID=875803 RepID=UPI002674A643|nr:hypothetical protein [uncultured Adlercreutzia sp.]